MDFTAGLLALGVGVAFDWQRVLPAFGNRVAALCALAVGEAWLVGGQVSGWLTTATDTATKQVGQSGHQMTSDIPASGGSEVFGVVLGIVFLMWFLAVLPAMGVITKHFSSKVESLLTSGLIWLGAIFPPLIRYVPGHWGVFARHVVLTGAHVGLAISGWIL